MGIRFRAKRGIGPTQASLDGAPGTRLFRGHPVSCEARHRSHPSKLGWGTRHPAVPWASGFVRSEASIPPKQAWMGHPAPGCSVGIRFRAKRGIDPTQASLDGAPGTRLFRGYPVSCEARHRSHPSKLGWGTRHPAVPWASGFVRSEASIPPKQAWMGHPAVPWASGFVRSEASIPPKQAWMGHPAVPWASGFVRSEASIPPKQAWMGHPAVPWASGFVRSEASVPPKQAWMGHPAPGCSVGIRFRAKRGIGPTQASLDGAPGTRLFRGHPVSCEARHRSHPSKLGWGTRHPAVPWASGFVRSEASIPPKQSLDGAPGTRLFRGVSGFVRSEASIPPKQAWMGHPAVPIHVKSFT